MNIKKTISITVLSCTSLFLSAQSNTEGVSIAPNVIPPHPSAMLDVSSSNKGILIPRVTLISRTSQLPIVGAIKTSLMVFNEGTNLPQGYYYWSGVEWLSLGGGLWSKGSTGNFIYNSSDGEVGILTGNTQPIADLEINGKSFDDNAIPPLATPLSIPAFFVKGRAVFSGGAHPPYANSNDQIRIGEPASTVVGGRWNEINCTTDLDINYNTGNDVRIGASLNSGFGPGANLRVWGNIYAINGSTLVLSDSTQKENILPLSAGVLGKLASCKGYTYKLKNDTKHRNRSGVMAQEIELQFPTLVENIVIDDPKLGPASTYKTLDYNGLTAVLLEAIKELKIIIEQQEQRILTLENP